MSASFVVDVAVVDDASSYPDDVFVVGDDVTSDQAPWDPSDAKQQQVEQLLLPLNSCWAL